MRLARTSFALLLSLLSAPAWAIDVDGRIDPAEWQGAQHVTDFRQVQPLTRAPGSQPTEGWILATPEGLAIGFHSTEPANIPRTRQSAQRDVGAQADRVNLYVDFDGDGRTGYNFTVLLSDSIIDTTITNENQFATDWDGNWKHAVSEDAEGWSAEMLIPWYIAPMRAGSGGKRNIGVQLDRVIGATGERMAWPAVSVQESRFLSVLAKVEVPEYSQSLLAVTPYVSGLYDNIKGGSHFDGGVDLFWKPNSRFQLSATLNPDFGQVESDQLVVNFSATETFFSDKRPFFTENQAFFDVPFGSLNNANRLLYTRRVGGPADDGDGSGDVTAAVKLNGSAGAFNYGVFAATEADEAGRDFYALRGTRDFETQGVGAMFTRVERPFLDREADVYEFDHRWTPNAKLSVRTTLVGSDIEQAGTSTRDSGGQVLVDYDHGNGWRQQGYALHLGDGLQLNDFGYLERNDFNYLRYQLAHRVTDLPQDSAYSAHDWRYAVSRRSNDHGVRITDAWAIDLFSDRRDGGNEFFEIAGFTPGHDDLVTRGNGVVDVPAKFYLYFERFTPRKDHWSMYWNARYAAEGLAGPAHGALSFDLNPTYFVNDNLSFYGELFAQHNPDWLLWCPVDGGPCAGQGGRDLLGSYRASLLQLNGGMQWIISAKQELRIKMETIALDAHALQGWQLAANGEPQRVADGLNDFSLRNLGFQIRYRYELAPLSNLYIAYVRGGFGFQDEGQGVGGLLGDAFSLRDDEQLFVKLSYRFEL
ncbi:hypothetical protein FNZ56_06040 [Pseudoluteimonas lycopersici]|uniref:DUF5916 domain-containing protein n=1 Tax=Pseudoluteimonas lycopersici TaxID=1324796 RepID=A0A516V4L5_9GAMM|nr:DUF5916 domain-containing protein [Lysobacter lycopersici]QDQ73459.1 hypothetical protein FNZ56_06040 [Lysobacter lycopersici]